MCRGGLTGVSTGTVFANVHVQKTNQAEAVQLEVYTTRGDEEDPRQQEEGALFRGGHHPVGGGE